jgi:site-specific DNA-methyltransferase (adenine-specific)
MDQEDTRRATSAIETTGEVAHHTGNCLALLPQILPASIDLMLADLPYGTTQCTWDTPIDLVRFWPAVWRALKQAGTAVLFATQPFTSRLISSAYDDFRYMWIWEKPKATGHLNSKKQPLRAHEDIVVFFRKPGTYNPQFEKGEAYKGTPRPASKTTEHYSAYGEARGDNPGIRYPRSVLRFSHALGKKEVKVHPTQKPVALLRYLIRTYSNPGDVVLDPCEGSGSTGEAAVLEGRKYIGIELDPVMSRHAIRRLKKLA